MSVFRQQQDNVQYEMFEQQFLTTFNAITNYNSAALYKDKKTNQIIDFINATYQGYTNNKIQQQGVGVLIDDQFNFVFCSDWKNGKLDGQTFVKLVNEIFIWGQWKCNRPRNRIFVKTGPYLIVIPYYDNHKARRPKKCLICHEGKGKIYIAVIEKYPQETKNKRQYSIVIQKIISMRQTNIIQVAQQIQIDIKPYQQDIIAYLRFLSQQLNIVKLCDKDNGLFITADFSYSNSNLGIALGLLLDRKKLTTKSVGTYNVKKRVATFREQQKVQQNEEVSLNGLGLSKTIECQTIIGVFKDNMLIRQLNSEQKIQSMRSQSKNYGRNLNGSLVKQLLSHQHMRSLSYEHNYIYFSQIKNIISVVIQLHKYVDMFERLSHQKQADYQQSINHHPSAKYQKNQDILKLGKARRNNQQQYTSSRINLNKQIYRQSNQRTQTHYNQTDGRSSKRPGFILTRTTDRKQRISKSPRSNSPHPGLNKKLPQRSPIKTQQKWRI